MLTLKPPNGVTPSPGFWEYFSHDAVIEIRGHGPSKAVAFEQAARALSTLVCDPALVRPDQTLTINCESEDDGMLLMEWFDALIFHLTERRMLFHDFQVETLPAGLRATLRGEPVDPGRHAPRLEIKRTILEELRVACDSHGQWLAQCRVEA